MASEQDPKMKTGSSWIEKSAETEVGSSAIIPIIAILILLLFALLYFLSAR